MNAKTMFALMCAAATLALGATAKDSGGGKAGGRDYYRMDAAELAKLAESGDVAAQHAHAYRLLMKGGKKPDMADVVRWLSKSAEGGYVPAQFGLGEILLNGYGGVATNEVAGVEWIRKAADAKPGSDDWGSQISLARARYELGVCYRDGRGVKKDAKRAFELFNSAQVDGKRHGKTDVALAECYEKGIGVAKDEVQAEKIYQAVADAGTGYTWYQNADAVGKANEWLWRNGKKDLYGTRFFRTRYLCGTACRAKAAFPARRAGRVRGVRVAGKAGCVATAHVLVRRIHDSRTRNGRACGIVRRARTFDHEPELGRRNHWRDIQKAG